MTFNFLDFQRKQHTKNLHTELAIMCLRFWVKKYKHYENKVFSDPDAYLKPSYKSASTRMLNIISDITAPYHNKDYTAEVVKNFDSEILKPYLKASIAETVGFNVYELSEIDNVLGSDGSFMCSSFMRIRGVMKLLVALGYSLPPEFIYNYKRIKDLWENSILI